MPTLRMFPSAHEEGAIAKPANAVKPAATKSFFMLTSSQIDVARPVPAGRRQRTMHWWPEQHGAAYRGFVHHDHWLAWLLREIFPISARKEIRRSSSREPADLVSTAFLGAHGEGTIGPYPSS